MPAFLARKRSRLTVASWLVMAVLGTFTFAALDSVQTGFTGTAPLRDMSGVSVNYEINCIATDSAAAGREKEGFSFRRSGSSSAVFVTGKLCPLVPAFLPLNISTAVSKPDIKNAVPLKLRI